MSDVLFQKILEKKAIIGIIGLGHTGLSLAHDFGKEGFKIIGFDTDRSKIEMLKKGESYFPFMPLNHLYYLLQEKSFLPVCHPDDLAQADIIIISVATPLSAEKLPNLSYLKAACMSTALAMKKRRELVLTPSTTHHLPPQVQEQEIHQLIIVQSTSYPGTTEEVTLPILETEARLKVGKDFFLAHVPEREDAGNPLAVLHQIPRICGGITPTCAQLGKALYEHITVKVHLCPSIKIAESTKVYENAFRLINIAFVDEMKMAFDKMGINIWEVIEAASTKPFGFTAFYPGPGIGGDCIPVDPLYFAWKAHQFGAETTLIEQAALINQKISDYVVQKISDALMQHAQKELPSADILLLGVAFKKDVSDLRNTPALGIIDLLKQKGANVQYHDFFIPTLAEQHLASISLNEKTLAMFDCVVILADHSRYNWLWICQNSKLIVDTRNATQTVDQRLKKKIVL